MYHEIDAKLPRATSKETTMKNYRDSNKQLLDKVFVTCSIIKAEADNTCRDLDYS